jgi:excisionase family DNA binding protein
VVDGRFLTSEDVAAALSVTPQTIRNWIKKGALPAERYGHVFRIRREDFEAFAGTQSTAGNEKERARESAGDVWSPQAAALPRRRERHAQSVWDGESQILPRRRA